MKEWSTFGIYEILLFIGGSGELQFTKYIVNELRVE